MRHFNRFLLLLLGFLSVGLNASANDWSDWFAMSDVTFNASTRTMKWKVVMYDDIGYDEMWRSDHGGMTIKVSKDNGSTWVTLGSVSCNSDGDDRKLSVASGAPGSLWGSDYGGSNRKYMYVNWTVPHEYLNCKLKFNMSGTWHYNGPGSNIGVNVTQEQTCSYQFSVSQINWDTSKNRIDVRPNGDVYAYYYLTGSGNSDALAHVVAYTGTNQSNMSWNGVGRITVGDKRENNISFGIDKISGASLKKGFYIRLQYEYWHKTTNNFYVTKTEDFYFPGYPYPSNLSARFDQTSKKVELHWNSNNTGHDQLGYWMVYRDGKFLTRLSESTTSYVDDGMSYEKDVQYTVRWSRQDYAYQTTNYFKGLETSSTVNTSRNVPIEGLNVNSLSDRITIDWNTSSYPSGWGHHFKIFVDDKEVGDLKPSADGQTSFNWQHINKYATIGEVTNYKTDDLDACGPHDYRIEGWVDNVKRSERAIEDQAIGNGVRFTKFSISKGSYEGKVRVSVNVSKISGTSDANLITIERRVAESSDNFVEMYRIQNGSNTVVWDDEEVKPGVYYEYRVSCATECTNGNNPLTAKNDIGFAQSMGTVAGQIAFGSGTAVEGVDVTLTPSGDANEANRQKHSLYLTDQDASCTWQFEGSDYVNEAFVDNDFTLQAWLWPSQVPTSSSTAYTIMDLGNSALMFNGEGLVWKTGNNSVYFRDDDMKLPEHHYSQVTLVRSGANYTAYVINYMDDTLHVGQSSQEGPSEVVVGNYNRLKIGGFMGYMDDFRFWRKALTEAEILSKHDRYLAGDENGLETYYTFDEGLDEHAFDYSKNNSTYHEHHAEMNASAVAGDLVTDDLKLKATTDVDGNYIIRGVPFCNDGTNYAVKPVLESHEFQPSQYIRYVSDHSLVHNSTDFTDISSFPFTGRVVYRYGNVPVDKAMVYVDGSAASKDGEPITVNEEGYFTVDVPIGEHFVSVKLDQHGFENGGRWPVEGKYNFAKAVGSISDPMVFVDTTTVRVVGKVVGGDVQASKPIGLRQTRNNIGTAEVVLKLNHSGSYQLNTSESDISVNSRGELSNDAVLQAGSDVVSIKTNLTTGEFIALLPPVSYTVESVKTADFETNPLRMREDFGKAAEYAFTGRVGVMEKDSIKLQNGEYERFEYSHKLVFTRHNPLQISMRDMAYDDTPLKGKAFGDSVFTYKEKELKLVTVGEDGNPVYAMQHPVFTMARSYKFAFSAYERYVNHELPEEDAEDIVRKSEYKLAVNNPLSSMKLEADMSLSSVGDVILTLNQDGEAEYNWQAGAPNVISPYTLTLTTLDYTTGNPLSPTVSGYVLGEIPVPGSNFVTQGPDVVDFVIHDPYGNSSYAWLEKGSSVRTTTTRRKGTIRDDEYEHLAHLGYWSSGSTGWGFEVEFELDVIAANGGYSGYSSTVTNDTTSVTEYTLSDRLTTSSSPEYVGSMADVFVGRSSNLLYGLADFLSFFPKQEDKIDDISQFSIGVKQLPTTGISFPTIFNYTRNHIENEMIPSTRKLRNALLKTVSDMNNVEHLRSATEVVYVTNLSPSDENFGKDGTYKALLPTEASAVDKSRDMVHAYNIWIMNWENALKDDEKVQVDADKMARSDQKKYNESFDAGTVKDVTSTTTVTIDHEKLTVIDDYKGYRNESNALFNHLGYTLKVDEGWHKLTDTGNGGGTTKTTEVGYHLEDQNQGDYISQDVIVPGQVGNGSYVFILQGGQSEGPWQQAMVTKYHEPGTVVGNSTMSLAAPVLQFADTGGKTATRNNIRAGKSATFQLRIGSNSPSTTKPEHYNLSVDPASNPDGLIIMADGASLSQERQYTVYRDQPITVTITVSQGRQDVFNYENVKLVLSPDYSSDYAYIQTNFANIEDEVTLNVSFLASSSDVNIQVGSSIVNLDNGNNQRLSVKCDNYDTQLVGFGCIDLMYKRKTESQYQNTFARYYLNKDVEKEMADKLLFYGDRSSAQFGYIDNNPSFVVDFDMSKLDDGEYDVCAVSRSFYSRYNRTAQVESQELAITKDTTRPQALGMPTPINGILDASGEISLQFNERIQTGLLSNENFQVTGRLNSSSLQHSASLHMMGKGGAATEQPISFTGTSTFLEAWVKREKGQAGMVFSQGSPGNMIGAGFTEDNYGYIVIGDTTYIGKEVYDSEGWNHLRFFYLPDLNVAGLMGFDGTIMKSYSLVTDMKKTYDGVGRLFVGSNPEGRQALQFDIHEVSLWNETPPELNTTKEPVKLSGTEFGLVSYWPMDELTGFMANDQCRGRALEFDRGEAEWETDDLTNYVRNLKTSDQTIEADIPTIVDNQDDFTLEFWARLKPVLGAQTDRILFKSKTISFVIDPNDELDINVREPQKTEGDGSDVAELASDISTGIFGLADNDWHHIALQVIRSSGAFVYVDGVRRYSFRTTDVHWDENDSHLSFGSGLVGSEFDEIRLWKGVRNEMAINLDRNKRLRGDEKGLLFYLPFEKYSVDETGAVVAEPSMQNVAAEFSQYVAEGGLPVESNQPAITRESPEQNLKFSWTASEDKIVIKLLEPLSDIEKTHVQFTVSDVLDMNDNKMEAPVTWTTYINRNALQWDNKRTSLVQEAGDETGFDATVRNLSGENAVFYIEGLPNWLGVSDTYGSIAPLGSQKLMFYTKEEAPIGSYDATVYLVGQNNVKEALYVSLKVTGEKPDWQCNPEDYPNNMGVVAQLYMKGKLSEDADDMVAAFIDGRCVGVGHPMYVSSYDRYYVMMTVFGTEEDMAAKRALTFKAWDASTGLIHAVTTFPEQICLDRDIYGSFITPVFVEGGTLLLQDIELKKGWNWISMNVDVAGKADKDVFADVISSGGTGVVKNQTEGFVFEKGGKYNSIPMINGDMYMVNVDEAQHMTVLGDQINVATEKITIYPGWSWIGYLPQQPMEVNYALAYCSASDGDMIKDQKSFAVFSGEKWIGDLKYLKPGAGYKFFSTKSKDFTFFYPTTANIRSSQEARVRTYDVNDYHFTTEAIGSYPDNMTILAVLKDGDQVVTNHQVGVFAGEECRASGFTDENGLLFLTVQGDADNVALTFKAWDTEAKKEKELPNVLAYRSDVMVGSISAPYELNFQYDATGIEGLSGENGEGLTQYFTVDGKRVNLDQIPSKGVYIIRHYVGGQWKTEKRVK